MRHYLPTVLLGLCVLAGCNPAADTKKAKSPSAARNDESPKPAAPKTRGDRNQRLLTIEQPAPSDKRKSPVQRLSIEGLWLASGWMGDAENPDGGLEYRTCNDGPYRCEHWTYTPGKGNRQFVAVAYQFLRDGAENNFGDQPGMDLGRKGFSRVAFYAKGKIGGERIVFHSGGHTRLGAPYPASYQATLGMVTLKDRWEKLDVSLENCDLRNTTAALVFLITPRQCPTGCEFYLRDIAFQGPED